jgi:hypothetical protein
MHDHLFRFSLAIVLAKLAFLAIVFGGAGWPAWVLGLETAFVLALGAAGLVLAWRGRREARWEGVLPLRREGAARG